MIGTIAVGIAVAAIVLASRRDSTVERWMRAVDAVPRTVRARSPRPDLLARRVAMTFAGGLVGSALTTFVPLGPAPVAVLAYAGWIAPPLLVERRVAQRRRAAERAVVTLVEWLHALVSSGRPPESAIADIAAGGTLDEALRGSLEHVRRDYVLGVPMYTALVREADLSGIRALSELATRLERARDLGRGGLPLLQELRDELRARERSRALAAAGAVEGKLTAVMTLCYLPALALLVIVPLFVTLLAGLFGP